MELLQMSTSGLALDWLSLTKRKRAIPPCESTPPTNAVETKTP
jgi:hypothetical protein